jgi:hypothetical protein
MMEVYAHSKKQMDEAGIGHDLITPQQRVAQATPQKPGVMGAVKDVAKGLGNWVQGKPETGPTYEDLALEEELNELAKLAGLEAPVREALAKDEATYGDPEVDDNTTDQDPVNKPTEKYLSMKASTMNPGEADPGEKQMNPDRPTFKNGDNAMSRPPVRESSFKLEAKLAKEYESIKKSS